MESKRNSQYLPTFTIAKITIHAGKYTIPMDPMGLDNVSTLPETNSSALKIGLSPKRNVHLQTIDF